MRNNKKVIKSTQGTNPAYRGFINIQLSEDDKAHIKALDMSDAVFVQEMFKGIEDGYKFTFSYDDYSHCFQCVGTKSQKEHGDYGVLLSGRGSTVVKSFKQWLFIVNHIIDGSTWESFLNRQPTDEIDD